MEVCCKLIINDEERKLYFQYVKRDRSLLSNKKSKTLHLLKKISLYVLPEETPTYIRLKRYTLHTIEYFYRLECQGFHFFIG